MTCGEEKSKCFYDINILLNDMAEELKKEKKPFRQRLKYATVVTLSLFFIGGFLLPILYKASFSFPGFLIAGFFSVGIMWGSIVIGHFFIQI